MNVHARAGDSQNFNEGASVPRTARGSLLVVEDDMCVSMMLEDVVTNAGFQVLKAARLPAAMLLASSAPIDGAILDVNLGGSRVFPAADLLRKRGIPFVFSSAYGRNDLPARFQQSGFLQKPFNQALLLEKLAQLAWGETSQRTPFLEPETFPIRGT